MKAVHCDLKYIAHDYQPVGEVECVASPGIFPLFSPDGLKRFCTGVLIDFLKHTDKLIKDKTDSIRIGRGADRKNDMINLWVSFAEKNNSEEESEDCDYTGLSEEDKQRAIVENNRAKRELNSMRIGGVVGALSGMIRVKPEKGDIQFECNVTLEIRSRMDSSREYYFISTLLQYARIDMHRNIVFRSVDDLFDFLLVDALYSDLKNAIPKGQYRTYRRFYNNDDRPKGSIDFARHIKENVGLQNGNIAYSFRENTIDNDFNRLLIMAYERIRSKFPELVSERIDGDVTVYDYLNKLKSNITMAPSRSAGSVNTRPITHPFYHEFERVRQTCLMILREEGLSIFDADEGEVRGFLYYLPDLWEIFLLDNMKKILGKHVVTGPEKRGYIKRNNNTGYSCWSKPDFVFWDEDGRPILILDAKFRIQWERAFGGYNLATYCGNDINKCIRDMVVFNAKGSGVIFPKKITEDAPEKSDNYKRNLSRLNEINPFYIIPFFVPGYENDCSYNRWKKRFDASVEQFSDILIDIVRECSSSAGEKNSI